MPGYPYCVRLSGIAAETDLPGEDLGFRTVFCGEQMHEPTREAADAFYLADWNETEALIRIGRREQISGIIGLCDKAMIPVAAVSETLGLPGNSSESMRKLLSKRSFRLLQEEAGVFCPRSSVSENLEEIERAVADFCVPVSSRTEGRGSGIGHSKRHPAHRKGSLHL